MKGCRREESIFKYYTKEKESSLKTKRDQDIGNEFSSLFRARFICMIIPRTDFPSHAYRIFIVIIDCINTIINSLKIMKFI